MCGGVCVYERDRQKDRETEIERDRDRERFKMGEIKIPSIHPWPSQAMFLYMCIKYICDYSC